MPIERVEGSGIDDKNEKRSKRVIPQGVADTATQLLVGVIQGGTGKAAQIGEFAAGKTGTTENYGDAWFVGFNNELTVAVWVGYPDHLKPMETEYRGSPVAGGTYPAEIWHDLMTSWIGIRDTRKAEEDKGKGRTPPPPAQWRRSREHARAAADPARSFAAAEEEVAPARATAAAAARTSKPPAPPPAARAAPPRPPRSRRAAGVAAQTPPGQAAVVRRAAASPAATGATRGAESASQKRQGRSTALVIPTRSPTAIRGSGASAAADGVDRPVPEASCRRSRARCRAPG